MLSTVSTVSTVLSLSPLEPIVPPTTPLQSDTIDLYAITFAQHILENTNEVVRTDDIDLCSNWWPTQHVIEKHHGMPHLLCRLCANWLPDIEEIGNIRIPNAKQSGCGNDWPAAKNYKRI